MQLAIILVLVLLLTGCESDATFCQPTTEQSKENPKQMRITFDIQ